MLLARGPSNDPITGNGGAQSQRPGEEFLHQGIAIGVRDLGVKNKGLAHGHFGKGCRVDHRGTIAGVGHGELVFPFVAAQTIVFHLHRHPIHPRLIPLGGRPGDDALIRDT